MTKCVRGFLLRLPLTPSKAPPNSDDNHHKKLRFPDRLNWPDGDGVERKNSTPISFSPFFIFDENSPPPAGDSVKVEVRHAPVSNSMIETKVYRFQRPDLKKRCWLTTELWRLRAGTANHLKIHLHRQAHSQKPLLEQFAHQ